MVSQEEEGEEESKEEPEEEEEEEEEEIVDPKETLEEGECIISFLVILDAGCRALRKDETI